MKKIAAQALLTSMILMVSHVMNAQSTYESVYTILQANCAVSCHNGSSNDNLDLSGSMQDVYDNIVNQVPVNVTAQEKGDKLIDPGYPHRSFLLRKCNNGLDPHIGIEATEGDMMPPAQALDNRGIELIRQWIHYGAPRTGIVVDKALINKFYDGEGRVSPATPFPVPTEAGAFQVHLGRVFVAPSSETQFYIKYDPRLDDDVEINKIEVEMGAESHHFVLLKFDPGTDGNYPAGRRELLSLTGPSHLAATTIGAFQNSNSFELPEGTAYEMKKGSVLDLNYHIINSDPDTVLAAELYLNMYTQPKGTAEKIMHIKGFSNYLLWIPNDGQVKEFTVEAVEPNNTDEIWNVWTLASHTHGLGIDFDVYHRNEDGSKGDQLYEGFYDKDYTFPTGFYDWEHPPIRYFDPYLQIDPSEGFVYEAKFLNVNGPSVVTFGPRSIDEMMIMYVQYTVEKKTVGIEAEPEFSLGVYPNPFGQHTQVRYELKDAADVKIGVFNALGERIVTVVDERQASGNHIADVDLGNYASGIYMVKFESDGKIVTTKLLKM